MGVAEHGRQAIAGMLVNPPTPGLYDGIQDAPHRVNGVTHPFGVHILRQGRETGEIGDKHRQLAALPVAGFYLNLFQFPVQRHQCRIDSAIQVWPSPGEPAVRFECGDGFHQCLTANVWLSHARYYINSRVRTRTCTGRNCRATGAGREESYRR